MPAASASAPGARKVSASMRRAPEMVALNMGSVNPTLRRSRSIDGAARPGSETWAAASCSMVSRIFNRSFADRPSSIRAGSRTARSPSLSTISTFATMPSPSLGAACVLAATAPFPDILIGFELPLRAIAAPISVRFEKRAPGLDERRLVAETRPCGPADHDAGRIGELGVGAEIELPDQTRHNPRVIELAEPVLQRRGLTGVALDRRAGMKERAKEFGRIAHVFQ